MLLIAGTVGIIGRLWSGDLAVCDARCESGALGPVVWAAWYLAANGLVLVAGVLAYWLARCLTGWWAARRGDDARVASHGGSGWAVVIALLCLPNVAGLALLMADALHAADAAGSAESWVDAVTLASNVWVLAYYARRRTWDGRRV